MGTKTIVVVMEDLSKVGAKRTSGLIIQQICDILLSTDSHEAPFVRLAK